MQIKIIVLYLHWLCDVYYSSSIRVDASRSENYLYPQKKQFVSLTVRETPRAKSALILEAKSVEWWIKV